MNDECALLLVAVTSADYATAFEHEPVGVCEWRNIALSNEADARPHNNDAAATTIRLNKGRQHTAERLTSYVPRTPRFAPPVSRPRIRSQPPCGARSCSSAALGLLA